MMSVTKYIALCLLACSVSLFPACAQHIQYDHNKNPYYSHVATDELHVPDSTWKRILPGGIYDIARMQETERAYSGKYWDNHAKGTYYCAVCGNLLFVSATKFDSQTGWPSFYQPASGNSVLLRQDVDGFRTEVVCKRCGSHLGHVFDDGPAPTHQRYCMNGNVLDFTASAH